LLHDELERDLAKARRGEVLATRALDRRAALVLHQQRDQRRARSGLGIAQTHAAAQPPQVARNLRRRQVQARGREFQRIDG
jgi:hypothetical protein